MNRKNREEITNEELGSRTLQRNGSTVVPPLKQQQQQLKAQSLELLCPLQRPAHQSPGTAPPLLS